MRRVSAVDGMLLGTVLLWALNTTVSKYLLTHRWDPLAYGVIRYAIAILLFWAFTWWRERSFRIARRDLPLVALAGATIFVNQLCFVYSLEYTTASTVALMFGTTPVFVGVIGVAVGLERLGRRFWAAALVTFAGVALIALASGGGVATSRKGALLGLSAAVTWGVYSLAVAPLMRRYSPFRISSIVLLLGWLPLAGVGSSQVASQHFSFGALVWVGFAYAVIGPLFLTNLLWFTAIDRVGAARASLFSNLQPFFAVFFAIVLLSERLHRLEIAGGVLIFAGILLERVRIPTSHAPETPVE
ncbi:MAG TPA: DMT family transporter [Gaiellaceae bacterium]|nr:DMT family transporter [Gaiellaceae bacterium]